MMTPSSRKVRRPLAAWVMGLVLLYASPVVVAQETQAPPASINDDKNYRDTIGQEKSDRFELRDARHKRDRRDRDRRNRQSAAAVEPLYPEATREEPEARASRTGLKRLQALTEVYNAGDDAATLAAALEVAEDAKSNAYEKSFAYQIAGTAASGAGDDSAAADYFAKAVEADGLANNDHYATLQNLAVVQYTLERYDQALQTVDRFLAETRSTKPELQGLRGTILMALERYTDAADVYVAQLEASPENNAARMNAVAAYQHAGDDAKAMQLLADARDKGLLADTNGYRALYVSYLNTERDKDALAVIEEGLAKGSLQENPDLARAFMIIGQNAYFAEDEATAIAMYERAAPMADNGEAALNLAKLYAETGNKAKAKAAAELALSKGVKDTAAAKRIAAGK